MKSNNRIESVILIIIGIIVICFFFNTSFEASKTTLDDFEYFKGYVVYGYSKDVWLVTDTTVDVHSIEQRFRGRVLHLEISDSDVLSRLIEIHRNADHTVEVWYQSILHDYRRCISGSGSNSPLIRQIVVDGEVILPYDKYVSCKYSIVLSIPMVVLILYCIKALIIGKQNINEINNEN